MKNKEEEEVSLVLQSDGRLPVRVKTGMLLKKQVDGGGGEVSFTTG